MVGVLPVVRVGRTGTVGDREGVAGRTGPEMKAWVIALAVVSLGAGQAPTFRTDIETVRVDVLVTKGGRPVPDLGRPTSRCSTTASRSGSTTRRSRRSR